MGRFTLYISIACLLGLGLALGLLWALGLPINIAQAQGPDGYDTYYVAPGGDCGAGVVPCYSSVQAAVDAADDPGDVIKIAAGVYTGVQARPAPPGYGTPEVVTQVVYISKTLAIQGGYTTANWQQPDYEANLTTLDAQGEGRVIFITAPAPGAGGAGPTIEGLRITGGEARRGGGTVINGGGVHIFTATATLANNRVFGNSAHYGGGLSLSYSSATLEGNTVISNTAWYGGGIALLYSFATLKDNTVTANFSEFNGGGLYLLGRAAATIEGNTVTANTADCGGGMYLYGSAATLSDNTVTANTADYGGGLALEVSDAMLDGNVVRANTANQQGGGVYVYLGEPMFSRNAFIANTAGDRGGGLYLYGDMTLVNNVVADNQASTAGSGAYLGGHSYRLLHTTIANNRSGAGSGVYITDDGAGNYSTVMLVNTILVSHTVGIAVAAGNTATLESTLWNGNGTDWSGAGAVITTVRDYWGDPAFAAGPATGDYHIGAGSAAIDAGINAGVTKDIDGEPRPVGNGYDLGADEYQEAPPVTGPCYAQVSSIPGITHTTVQAAVNTASEGDTVKVAGTCAGVEHRAGLTQTVYINKSIILRGGYTITNWLEPDYDANPTTLDARGQGRVVYAVGDSPAGTGQVVNLTIEGLRLTGGNATGLGGGLLGWDVGGGMYIISAAVTLRNNHVFGNSGGSSGGGLYLQSSDVVLDSNTVVSNTASRDGGGLYLLFGDAVLDNNVLTANTAGWSGGGLYVVNSTATLSHNRVFSNTAGGSGGGMCIVSKEADVAGASNNTTATIVGNQVFRNTAGELGGGICLNNVSYDLTANLVRNEVLSNTAGIAGGGVYVARSLFSPARDDVRLEENAIVANRAERGGGLGLSSTSPALSRNIISGNTADDGGGLYLSYGGGTYTNTIIVDNWANTTGSGLYVRGARSRLLHTTIAHNRGGDGSGIYVTWNDMLDSKVALTNTIIVSQTVGITVAAGPAYVLTSSATLDGVLWFGNGANTGGTGVFTVTHIYTGDPAFVNPGTGDYHIGPGSAAIDAGVDAGVYEDWDGEPRPTDGDRDGIAGFDVGADEYIERRYVYLPLVVKHRAGSVAP